jgi:hypothetical protein
LIELGKWNKSVEEIENDNLDIDKLLYLMKTTEELTLNENETIDFKFPSFFTEDWIQKAIHELDLSQMPPEKRAMVEMQLVQDAQLAYHYEEDKLNYAKEYAKEIEQEKNKIERELVKEKLKAEQKLAEEKVKAEQEKVKAEQEKLKAEQKLAEEKVKAKQEKLKAEQKLVEEKVKAKQEKVKAEQKLAEEKRNGHKLLISSFLKINYSKKQIADLQSWEIKYVEGLIEELNKKND